MTENKIKTRIVHKHALESNWLKAKNFIPLQGELIVYDIEVDADGNILALPDGRETPYNYARFKVGDGKTSVVDLPFADEELARQLANLKEETVAKLSTLDIENSNLREYYIADGEVLNTTETSIQLEEGQYIIVQAKARANSGYTSSDWSYLDSEGNPIAPPDPIPLVPWKGAIPTPIVTITNNVATWEANENAESYNYRIGTVVQPYSKEYPCFAKRERVYVQDSYGDVYTRYALSWDGRAIESPNAGRYGMPKNRMSSIVQRWPYGFVKVPAYKRADMVAMQEEFNLYGSDMKKLTAPVAYVDETLDLANATAKEYADNIKTELEGELNDVANAVNYTKTNNLLVLDDLSPLAKSITIHSEEGGTGVRVSGSNFAYKDTLTVKGSTSWYSSHITIYPPKNRKYVLSCDFENITGLKIGIAIKPDNSSKDWWKEITTTEASGSLSLEVEGGDYTDTRGVALRFYSNSTASAVDSECIFKNIVFRLADMEVPVGTTGIQSVKYITNEEGDVVVNVPDVSPVLVYNINGAELSATYSKDINKHFEDLDVANKKYADEAANAVKNDLLNGAGTAYDTLKELGDLIDENVDAIDALETVASGKADADHTHNDIYYTETEIDNKVSAINTSIATSLNEAKSYSATNLNTATTYTDNAVSQKSQVQIIIWEDDD